MKKTHIIGLVIIAFSIGILFSVMGSSSSYATFSEAGINPDRKFHVVGQWVKEKGLQYDPVKDPNLFTFAMRDDSGAVMNVVLHSNKPQDFERAEKVVVVGKMEGTDFHASQILMKCPSKYNAGQPKMEGGNPGGWIDGQGEKVDAPVKL